MTAERALFIPDLLETHAQSLAFVWRQRRAALVSQRLGLRELADLDERLEAHLQGLALAPQEVLVDRLSAAIAERDRDDCCALALALLQRGQAADADIVLREFSRAQGEVLAGLRDALGVASCALTEAGLQAALAHAKPTVAVAAAVVLANHRRLDAASGRLAELLVDADTDVGTWAWRAAMHADAPPPGAAGDRPVVERPWMQAIASPEPTLRHATWAAAAWSAQAWTLPLLRDQLAKGDAVALQWLAVLALPDDAAPVQRASLSIENAARRCATLARHGHPAALNAFVRWMEGEDVALAAAAGEGFTRITGIEVRGERTPLPVAAEADAFTREMTPDVWLPDPARVKEAMEAHLAEWEQGARWCRGLCLDSGVPRQAVAGIDFELRWDAAVRGALAGLPISRPPPIF